MSPGRDGPRSLKERDLAAEGLIALEGSFLVEKGFGGRLGFRRDPLRSRGGRALAEASGASCPLRVLPEPELAALAGFPFHRGVIGLARRPALADLSYGARPPEGNLLCPWQVTDPENLGALLRSGAALGAKAAVLGPGCADPFYPKALRASMGAAFRLPLYRASEADLGLLCAPPRTGVAAVLGGEALSSASDGLVGEGGTCLFLGNEGWGLPWAVLDSCRRKIEIPMSGMTDSLNVAASGAILMWELFGKGAAGAS